MKSLALQAMVLLFFFCIISRIIFSFICVHLDNPCWFPNTLITSFLFSQFSCFFSVTTIAFSAPSTFLFLGSGQEPLQATLSVCLSVCLSSKKFDQKKALDTKDFIETVYLQRLVELMRIFRIEGCQSLIIIITEIN